MYNSPKTGINITIFAIFLQLFICSVFPFMISVSITNTDLPLIFWCVLLLSIIDIFFSKALLVMKTLEFQRIFRLILKCPRPNQSLVCCVMPVHNHQETHFPSLHKQCPHRRRSLCKFYPRFSTLSWRRVVYTLPLFVRNVTKCAMKWMRSRIDWMSWRKML